jgi:ankyrin repeat protein
MGKIKEQSQALERAGVHKAFKDKMKVLFKQVKEELEIKQSQSQSQQRKDSQSIQSLQELQKSNSDLLRYASQGDASAVTRLLAAGADVNCKDCYGNTPLLLAIDQSDINIVSLLMATKSIDVNIANREGIRPLYYAVRKENAPIVNLLLTNPKIKVNHLVENAATPLHVAIALKNSVISQALIQRDPSTSTINQTDIEGSAALHHAAERGLILIVEELLNLGAAITSTNNGSTPLHFAAVNNQLAIVKILLNQDPDLLDKKSNDGSSALTLASSHGCIDIVEFLIGLKASTATAHNSNTPLHLATHKGYLPIVQALLQYNSDLLNASNNQGGTALMIASQEGFLDIAQYLLQLNSAITVDNDGCTPLHYAAYNGHLELIKVLLQYHPSLINEVKLVEDSEPQTALSLAAIKKDSDIVQYLLETGAFIGHSMALTVAFDNSNKAMALALIQHPLLAKETTDFKTEELQQIEAALSLSERIIPILLETKSEWIEELQEPMASFSQSLEEMRLSIQLSLATIVSSLIYGPCQSASSVTTMLAGQDLLLFSKSTPTHNSTENDEEKDSNNSILQFLDNI